MDGVAMDDRTTQSKRRIRIAPRGGETQIRLARAVNERQLPMVGEQGGGRVWLFLETDDFDADDRLVLAEDIQFDGEPGDEPYGRGVV